MRTQGSLRLILNTKLWPQMQVDKASEKSVRITAMDTEDQGVKVFLISVCIAIHYTRAGHKNNVCVCVCAGVIVTILKKMNIVTDLNIQSRYVNSAFQQSTTLLNLLVVARAR